MRVVFAPDKFAGTMTAAEAGAAMAEGWLQQRPADEVLVVPMADGGEGLIDVVSAAVPSSARSTRVLGPMGDPVDAVWLRLPDGRAVVEAAAAAGLSLVPLAERDPLRASTIGVGQLIAAAAADGCSEIVIGLGGSGTVDGGAGMAAALGAAFHGMPSGVPGLRPRLLRQLSSVTNISRPLPMIVAAVDVDNPLLGPPGAATVFGPQKGADAAAVQALEAALRHYADVVERDLDGGPWRDVPGAGAAGGLGFGLLAFTGARIVHGAGAVAGLVGFDTALTRADAVVTGEGSLDAQTMRGKAPDYVRRAARAAGLPVYAIAGRIELSAAAAFDGVSELGPGGLRQPFALTRGAAAELARFVSAHERG